MRRAVRARSLVPTLIALASAACRVTPPSPQPPVARAPVEAAAAPERVPAEVPRAAALPIAPTSIAPAPIGPTSTASTSTAPTPIAPRSATPPAPTALPPPRHLPAPGRPAPHPSPAAPTLPPPLPDSRPIPAPTAAPVATTPEPRTFRAWVERLRHDAASGADPALSTHVALLDALAAHPPPGTTETTIVRVPELEATARSRPGAGLGFATITSYVEPGGDADAVREAYLDFDRVPEFTGKPGTRTLSREPGAVVAKADAIRRTLGFEYGARWTFRARRLERGSARLLVTTQVDADDTAHMLFTRGLFLAVPEADGLHVAEIALSVMDYTVPALLEGIAERTVRREMLARTGGLRAHWREYVR